MQFEVPDFLSVRAGVGDVPARVAPRDGIAEGFHPRAEFGAGAGGFHGLLDGEDGLEFPAAAFDRGAVFPRSDRLRGDCLGIRAQDGQAVGGADAVAFGAHPFEGAAVGAEFAAVQKTDRVDDQMVMDALPTVLVGRVQMRCDQHLEAGEEGLGQRTADRVRRGVGDPLPRREGLRVVGEPDAGGLMEPLFGQQEFRAGGLPAAIHAGEVLPPVRVGRLALLRDIADHRTHGRQVLRRLADEITGRHRSRGRSGSRLFQTDG